MIQAIEGETALSGRKIIKSGGTGEEHWRTDFLGKRADGEIKDHQRMGPGMTHTGPDPRATGGQYYLVVNGSLALATGTYSAWSTVFVPATDAPLAFAAGPKGVEALLLQFARNSQGPVPTNS